MPDLSAAAALYAKALGAEVSAALAGSIYLAGGFDGVNYLASVLSFTPEGVAPPRPAPCPSANTWSTSEKYGSGSSSDAGVTGRPLKMAAMTPTHSSQFTTRSANDY